MTSRLTARMCEAVPSSSFSIIDEKPIGRAGGRPLLIKFGPKIGLNAERFERVERLFQRKGVWVVLTARFVILLRQLNGLVAGSMRMHFPRFLMANAAGGALWVSVWVFIGYTFGHEVA